MKALLSTTAIVFAIVACAPGVSNLPSVLAVAETTPVASNDDAADDPAVWVNENDRAASLILGTDKKAGLYAYTLNGDIKQFIPSGRLNNVDVRQNVQLGDRSIDIAAASNRTNDSITLFSIEDGVIAEMGSFSSVLREPYGFCLGVSDGGAFAVVTYKTGDLVLYELTGPADGLETQRLKFDTQLEGCVFDDETGVLFIGEEERGIWKAPYADGEFGGVTLVDEVGGASGIVADVEGLALYKTGDGKGYLLASSQGDNSYAVYDRAGENAFITRFVVASGEAIDGSEETDGIEAIAADLGPGFPNGLFVAQDGFNAPKRSPQNFKIVDFRDIQSAIDAAETDAAK